MLSGFQQPRNFLTACQAVATLLKRSTGNRKNSNNSNNNRIIVNQSFIFSFVQGAEHFQRFRNARARSRKNWPGCSVRL